mgnify:FL=1
MIEPSDRNRPSTRPQRTQLPFLRFVVHSGLLVAAIATVMAGACAAGMGGALGAAGLGTIFFGTLAVYAYDRRIDDRVDRPHRQAFDARHRRLLTAISVGSAAIAAWIALRLPSAAMAVLAVTVLLALAHPLAGVGGL